MGYENSSNWEKLKELEINEILSLTTICDKCIAIIKLVFARSKSAMETPGQYVKSAES